MAITATFYTFSKRENSTKKPTSGGTPISITFKEETNFLQPVIEVHYAGAFNFNYCYINFTGRYYFIESVDSIAYNAYTLQLNVDVLASHIDTALGQNVFATFCSYDFNEWLDDTRITTGHNITIERGTAHNPAVIIPPDNNGVIKMQGILAAITDNGYLMGMDFCIDDASGSDIAPLIRKFSDLNFIQSLKSGSPWDAVCEVYYVPFTIYQCIDVSERQRALELWDFHFICDRIESNTPKHHTASVALPLPSNIDFRFADKYVKYYINVPFSGLVQIPTSLVLKAYNDAQGVNPSAQVVYSADPFTGQFAAEVSVGGTSLGMYGANLKVPVQLGGRLSQNSVITKNAILGGAGAAAAAMAGGAGVLSIATLAGAGVGALAGGIKGAVDIPPLQSTGTYGGNAAIPQINQNLWQFYCVKVETDSNIDPATLADIAGRPAQKITTIQNGYIQASNASIALAASPEEIRQFNTFLNGGVYVE